MKSIAACMLALSLAACGRSEDAAVASAAVARQAAQQDETERETDIRAATDAEARGKARAQLDLQRIDASEQKRVGDGE